MLTLPVDNRLPKNKKNTIKICDLYLFMFLKRPYLKFFILKRNDKFKLKTKDCATRKHSNCRKSRF